jgi:hypothetical protein
MLERGIINLTGVVAVNYNLLRGFLNDFLRCLKHREVPKTVIGAKN